jgi:salicylate hydroxylase
MDKAIQVLGEWKANNFHHHVGPGAHLTHYPVANHKMLNVVVFLSDPNPWGGDQSSMVAEGTRAEVEAALAGWHPTVLSLVRLLPDKLVTWGLFDLGEFPAPTYTAGRVCLAGDAAHASSPHHGAGACLGVSSIAFVAPVYLSYTPVLIGVVLQVEDALCLSVLLGKVREMAVAPGGDLDAALRAAFQTFDTLRRPRTQWLVNSSRRVCDLYHQSEWADPKRWVKAGTCFEEIRDRSYKIWHFDADDMVRRAVSMYKRKIIGKPGGHEQENGEKRGYVL